MLILHEFFYEAFPQFQVNFQWNINKEHLMKHIILETEIHITFSFILKKKDALVLIA